MKKLIGLLYRCNMFRLNPEEKNILLRGLEARMENLTPQHEDVLGLREWMANPTPEFAATKSLYDKIYNVQTP